MIFEDQNSNKYSIDPIFTAIPVKWQRRLLNLRLIKNASSIVYTLANINTILHVTNFFTSVSNCERVDESSPRVAIGYKAGSYDRFARVVIVCFSEIRGKVLKFARFIMRNQYQRTKISYDMLLNVD